MAEDFLYAWKWRDETSLKQSWRSSSVSISMEQKAAHLQYFINEQKKYSWATNKQRNMIMFAKIYFHLKICRKPLPKRRIWALKLALIVDSRWLRSRWLLCITNLSLFHYKERRFYWRHESTHSISKDQKGVTRLYWNRLLFKAGFNLKKMLQIYRTAACNESMRVLHWKALVLPTSIINEVFQQGKCLKNQNLVQFACITVCIKNWKTRSNW